MLTIQSDFGFSRASSIELEGFHPVQEAWSDEMIRCEESEMVEWTQPACVCGCVSAHMYAHVLQRLRVLHCKTQRSECVISSHLGFYHSDFDVNLVSCCVFIFLCLCLTLVSLKSHLCFMVSLSFSVQVTPFITSPVLLTRFEHSISTCLLPFMYLWPLTGRPHRNLSLQLICANMQISFLSFNYFYRACNMNSVVP